MQNLLQMCAIIRMHKGNQPSARPEKHFQQEFFHLAEATLPWLHSADEGASSSAHASLHANCLSTYSP